MRSAKGPVQKLLQSANKMLQKIIHQHSLHSYSSFSSQWSLQCKRNTISFLFWKSDKILQFFFSSLHSVSTKIIKNNKWKWRKNDKGTRWMWIEVTIVSFLFFACFSCCCFPIESGKKKRKKIWIMSCFYEWN